MGFILKIKFKIVIIAALIVVGLLFFTQKTYAVGECNVAPNHKCQATACEGNYAEDTSMTCTVATEKCCKQTGNCTEGTCKKSTSQGGPGCTSGTEREHDVQSCASGYVCCKPLTAATCTANNETGMCTVATACPTGTTKIEGATCAVGQVCCKQTTTTPLAECPSGSCIDKPASGTCPEGKDLKTPTKPCTGTQICCVAKDAAAGASDQSGAPGGETGTGSGGFDIFGTAIAIITFGISMIIHLMAWFCGQLITLLMEGLIFLFGYNAFIRNEFVSEGWKVLRDLVNMFFVLGLLLIAFATVLKIERYSWNKLLGKLLIMAVLVNFSKTICGVVIDFHQVLMMTFVNAFKDITAGNIFSGLGMTSWFKVTVMAVAGQVSAGVQLGMIASALLGLILSIVCMVVIFIYMVVVGARIVALWILVVFSPLAFFAYIFEGTSKIGQLSQTWWQEFLQYCMIGPLLAFILWISVATLPKLDVNKFVMADYFDPAKRQGIQATFSEAGGLDRILKYMMSILMLVVGLGYAQKFKVVGAGLMAGAFGKMKDMSVGNLDRGFKWGIGAPGRAISPYYQGAKAGISERLQRAPLARVLTKKGREQMAKAGYERARGAVPGIGRLGVREERAKQAQDYKSMRKDINWESPDAIRKEMYEYDKNGNIRKDDKGNKIFKTKDRRFLESAYTALADAGKLTHDDIKDMDHNGLRDDMKDPRERQVFLEDMEKRQEKKTHIKKPFSSLVYNPDTNEYEDFGEIEKKGADAKQRLAGQNIDLSNVDWDKIRDSKSGKLKRKLDKDGEVMKDAAGNEMMSDDFNKLDAAQKTALLDLEKAGTGTDSDLYNIARSAEIKDKKYKEVRKSVATANETELNDASKQANLGDIMKNPPNFALAEVDGFTDQIPRIGKLDQVGRDNLNAKTRFMMGDGKEREALIKAHPELFDSSLHGMNADQLSGKRVLGVGEEYSDEEKKIQEINELRDKMSEAKLQKFQDLIKESSASFNAIGQKQAEGIGLGSLEGIMRQKRATEGITAQAEKKIIEDILGTNKAYAPQVTKFVNTQAGEMLAGTADMSPEDRKKMIVARIESSTPVIGDSAEELADFIIQNEVKIRDRDTKTKDVRKQATIKINTIMDDASRRWSTDKDTGRVQFQVDALINQINDDIQKGALSEDALNPGVLEAELAQIKNAVGTAATKGDFDKAMRQFEDSAKKLGYQVKSTRKGGNP